MFFRKVENKQFDHIPRFYNPDDDIVDKRKRKLKFRVDSKLKKKSRFPIMLVLFIIVIIYFIVKLKGGA
ncbi:MAG: hypothetical protein PF445_08365 [Melioribacteraceae bacterium]|nr:hypothetical protein [Melioribacteraceae bacterium]